MKYLVSCIFLLSLSVLPATSQANNCASDLGETPTVKQIGACLAEVGRELHSLQITLKSAIVAFESECPAGWTRYAKADGRFILGVSPAHPLGEMKGEETVTLTETQMPKHQHATTPPVHKNIRLYPWQGPWGVSKFSPATFNHRTSDNRVGYYAQAVIDPSGVYPLSEPVGNDENSHNNMPPFIALYFCKKD